jgi:hypothetical protein
MYIEIQKRLDEEDKDLEELEGPEEQSEDC